jgi:hypothetical protein
MCQPASMIIRKGQRPYWSPNTESHTELVKELGLRDDTLDPQFVRVEIGPTNGDMNTPLDKWQYRLEQDLRPDWYDAEEAEFQVREALVGWAKMKLLRDGVYEVKSGNRWALANSQVTAWGTSQVTALANSQVTALANSQVTARGNSQVTALANSQVTAWGNSQVTAWGNSQVTAWDNSQVTAWGNSQVTARDNSQVTALDNSQVTALANSQVTAWANSQVTAWDNSQVTARDNSQVTARDNSTTNQWSSACTVALSERAVNVRRDKTVGEVVVEFAKPNRSKKTEKTKP